MNGAKAHTNKFLDCLGLGIIAFDHLITLERFPVSNSKNVVKSLVEQGGGPTATAMAVLGMLGKKAALVSKMGRDAASEHLVNELVEFNVVIDYLIRDASIPSPEAFILIDVRNGDRTVMLHRSEKANLRTQELPFDLIAGARFLHLDGHETSAALSAARIAHKSNTFVSLDIGSNRFVPQELLELTHMAVVSQDYANAQLVKNNSLKSAQKLLSYGPKIAGVTCGERGSYFATHKAYFFQPALPVTAVDSTGAGDVFHGALLYSLVENYSLKQAALFASATAALTCTRIGGKAGIPHLDEIVNLLQKNDYDTKFIHGGKR